METVPKDIRFILFGLVDGKTLAKWSRVCKGYRQSIKDYLKFIHQNCDTNIHCFNESCCVAEKDDLMPCKNVSCSSCKTTFCQNLVKYRTQCSRCKNNVCKLCADNKCCKKVYCVDCKWQRAMYQECDNCGIASCKLYENPLHLEDQVWCNSCLPKCKQAICYNCSGPTCTCYRCAYDRCEFNRVGCPNCSNNLSVPGSTCRNKCRKFRTKKEFGTWFL